MVPPNGLISLLACPVCHGTVDVGEGSLTCHRCRRAFPEVDGVVDFTPRPFPDVEVDARRPLWEQVERNGLVSYAEDPERNLSVTQRDVCLSFGSFARFEGVVLDVGCGPQRRPSYAVDFDGMFVGIDPLRGELSRDFPFVLGVGEYLPFRDDVFDRILFATTLDHMVAPTRALAEARRVAKPSGHIVVWYGDKSERPPHAGPSADWYEALRIPEGADDRFHVNRFDRAAAERLLSDSGLVAIDEETDGHGSVFVRLRTA